GTPLQLDVGNGLGEAFNGARRRVARRKHEPTFRGHEEGGGVEKQALPRRRALASDPVGDQTRKGAHAVADRRGVRRIERRGRAARRATGRGCEYEPEGPAAHGGGRDHESGETSRRSSRAAPGTLRRSSVHTSADTPIIVAW